MKIKKMAVMLSSIAVPISIAPAVVSCGSSNESSINAVVEGRKIIIDDYKKSFNFMQTVMNKNALGYGMVPDRYFVNHPMDMLTYHQSNDALGWLLSSIVIGSEKGWITKDDALTQTKKIVQTIMNIEHHDGMITHFSNRDGTRRGDSEFATATTFLVFGGFAVAESYFKDASITSSFNSFIDRINWGTWIRQDFVHQKSYVKMSWNDQHGGYGAGFQGEWAMSAEQQLIYLMYAAKDHTTNADAQKLYKSFNRRKNWDDYVAEPGGTLFTYQFSHAYIDFQNINTGDDIDWHENTIKAIKKDKEVSSRYLANHDMKNSHYWGLSANDRANGDYRVIGTADQSKIDGWFSAWGQVGSIPYLKDEALVDIYNVKTNVTNSWNDDFGFYDGYNPKYNTNSSTILPLDKGMEMVMISSYLDNIIKDAFKNSSVIKKAMKKLNWTAK